MPPRRKEEWRPIPGWPNHEVSNRGRFRKKACRDGRGFMRPAHVLKVHVQRYDAAGHVRSFVCLYDGKRRATPSAGKLVLLAFAGPKPTKKHVTRHLDDDVANNDLDNLVWGTQKQNVADAVRNKKRVTFGERVHTSKLSDTVVRDIRTNCRPWSRTAGVRVFASKYGVSESAVTAVLSKRAWKHVAA